MPTLILEIVDLVLVINKYLQKLSDQNPISIEFTEDFYWSVLHDPNLFNPYLEVKDLSLGQLSDDIASVVETKNTSYNDIVFFELHHIAGLLEAIAFGKYKNKDSGSVTTDKAELQPPK